MTTCKRLFLILIAVLWHGLTAHAQRTSWPPSTEWYSVEHYGWPWKWAWSPMPSSVRVIPYPASSVDGKYKDWWVNQLMTRSVQGDIRGWSVSVTFTVNVVGGGRWLGRYWNGPNGATERPVDARLFLIGYDALYAQVSSFTPNLPDLTQWGRQSIRLPELPGSYTFTLTANASDPLAWTNVNGQGGTVEVCSRDVKQIGLCLSGGTWYSVGVGSPSPQESRIQIQSIVVQ